MPNPTDTARALVKGLDEAARDHEGALLRCLSDATIAARAKTYSDARAALLAHVAGVEQAARDLARHRYALKCEHLNHARYGKGYYHEFGETCPVEAEVDKALAVIDSLATRPTEARDEK